MMRWTLISLLVVINLPFASPLNAQPYMANGIKIGEVTSTSAIIWSRLTEQPQRNLNGVPFRIGDLAVSLNANGLKSIDRAEMPNHSSDDPYWRQLPDGKILADMVNAVSGAPGHVKLTYWKAGTNDERTVGWNAAKEDEDYTYQFELQDLEPGRAYDFKVDGRGADGAISATVESRFTTAPAKVDPSEIVFTVVSCTRWKNLDHPDGNEIYPVMAALDPDFFVHTGDAVYYDHLYPYAAHIDLARFHWHRMHALPRVRDFHNRVASYFVRDDHDTWQNDGWPGQINRMGNFTLADGQAVFREQLPMSPKTYRTARWGKDLQVWFSEGRDYRSPNPMPDGPNKTIWGKEQMAWFKKTVRASDATFKILVSPSTIVGPDHISKFDNHANPNFKYEGDIIRDFLAEHNVVVLCGDRHWQFSSKDTRTGVLEFGSGAMTDVHSGEINNDDLSMIKYINAVGGFLSVTVQREYDFPRIIFRHHDVDGVVLNEEIYASNMTPIGR